MSTGALLHVIDYDDAARDSIAFLLQASGYDVRTYGSGNEFLAASRAPGGCIITDVRMPGLSGLGLLAKLTESGLRPPVIVITGHADLPLATQAVRAGAFEFIEKPFDDEVLLRACEAALASAPAPESDRKASA